MRTLFFLLLSVSCLQAAVEFPLTEDSKPHPEIAKGELLKDIYVAKKGSVFPGTEREYTIYLPANFDRSKPAPFMVFQDGVLYQAPVAFDNLIAKGEIPPLVGIFIKPGVLPALSDNALPRFNRSFEYDSVTDTYSKFLIDELLPELEAKHQIKLSTDPNDVAISGNSSGGIAAFMVAWHRPDRFRRVFTGVGTYIGLRGGDALSVLVRKFEPKPLKIFLQSGTNDNNIYCGDWWMANQTMERSLVWSGYEVNHTWGEGGHDQKQPSQIFPDVLRYLWKGWPNNKEVKANPRGDSKWKGYEIFDAASSWIPVENTIPAGAKGKSRELVPDKDGNVVFADGEGALQEGIVTFEGNSVTISPSSGDLVQKKGEGNENVIELGSPDVFKEARLALSPDQSLLYITNPLSRYVMSAQLDANGLPTRLQPYIYLDTMDDDGSQAKGLCVDTEGRVYVCTKLGIQVCDQAGRVNFIIPTPGPAYDVCFGGKDLSELFIACGDSIYKRPTKVHGIISSQMPPVKPAAPKL